jgi:hypothetical protein
MAWKLMQHIPDNKFGRDSLLPNPYLFTTYHNPSFQTVHRKATSRSAAEEISQYFMYAEGSLTALTRIRHWSLL